LLYGRKVAGEVAGRMVSEVTAWQVETESFLRMASNWPLLPFGYNAITHLIPSVLFVQIEKL